MSFLLYIRSGRSSTVKRIRSTTYLNGRRKIIYNIKSVKIIYVCVWHNGQEHFVVASLHSTKNEPLDACCVSGVCVFVCVSRRRHAKNFGLANANARKSYIYTGTSYVTSVQRILLKGRITILSSLAARMYSSHMGHLGPHESAAQTACRQGWIQVWLVDEWRRMGPRREDRGGVPVPTGGVIWEWDVPLPRN